MVKSNPFYVKDVTLALFHQVVSVVYITSKTYPLLHDENPRWMDWMENTNYVVIHPSVPLRGLALTHDISYLIMSIIS